ncbi:MAG: hypothetical protein GWP62_08595 [Gammaproteobacteria bacterium]|jgi:hypothetical protein|nr:hypothetical protein [Gammaproteobacteria bacterium]
MIRKMILAILTTTFLLLSAIASADTVSQVWRCKLNEGKTAEDAQAINGEWLKRARELAGTDAITSTYVTAAVGDVGGFMWVDTFPDFATWAKLMDAEPDEELDAAFDELQTCEGSRLLQGQPTEAAK